MDAPSPWIFAATGFAVPLVIMVLDAVAPSSPLVVTAFDFGSLALCITNILLCLLVTFVSDRRRWCGLLLMWWTTAVCTGVVARVMLYQDAAAVSAAFVLATTILTVLISMEL